MALLITSAYTVLFEKLYTILRWDFFCLLQDITNSSFKIFKMMRFLRYSKCSKTIVELTFTAQKPSACNPWTACFAFDWKYTFWVNLVQKFKIVNLSSNLVLILIQICRISEWCPAFLFSTKNTFLGKFRPKNQNCQFEQKCST